MDLKRLAQAISKIYNHNPRVEAIILGGSVSRNWDDKYSDIELFVFWKEEPTDEDRKAPIIKLNGTIIDYYPYEDEEWSETFITQGVKLEMSHFLTKTINRLINEVVMTFDTTLEKQCIVATINNGTTLSGETILKRMKEKVINYPKELGVAMVEENIHLGNRWNNREALLHREDWLMLYKVMVDVQTKLMGILFGLNRQYVHHPAFKWQKQSLEIMEKKPENIVNRLNSIFLEHPSVAIKKLELILQEVYQLVQNELSQVQISSVMDKSLFLRPKQDGGGSKDESRANGIHS